LRVNLKDGGAEGLECTVLKQPEKTLNGEPNPYYGKTINICPWDKISDEAIEFYKKHQLKVEKSLMKN